MKWYFLITFVRMEIETPKYNFATKTNTKLTKLKHLKHHFCLHHLLVTSQGVGYIHYWNTSDIQGYITFYVMVCMYIYHVWQRNMY